MTSKVVEANDGVFSVGMAVAPVTDWRFYGITLNVIIKILGRYLNLFYIARLCIYREIYADSSTEC
jgi:hypothetical protein